MILFPGTTRRNQAARIKRPALSRAYDRESPKIASRSRSSYERATECAAPGGQWRKRGHNNSRYASCKVTARCGSIASSTTFASPVSWSREVISSITAHTTGYQHCWWRDAVVSCAAFSCDGRGEFYGMLFIY